MNLTKEETPDQKIGFWTSLRGRMITQILLVSLIPLIILSIIFLTTLNQAVGSFEMTVDQIRETMAKEVVGTKLQTLADETMAVVDTYMIERIHDIQDWAATPVIISALQEVAPEAEELNAKGLDIDQIEEFVGDKRELLLNSQAKAFLKDRLVRNPAFKEVFFTESHGYNVASSNPTSDFVQRDEEWWQIARDKGIYISEVDYDESAEIYAVDIAIRITHPETGQILGVMKASLDIMAIQTQISEIAGSTPGAEAILFEEYGNRIADSRSNHSPELIMTDAGNLFQLDYAPAKIAHAEQQSGYLLAQDSLERTDETDEIGYAPSAGADFYQDVPGFAGFYWGVLYIQPTSIAFQVLDPITNLEAALDNLQNSTTTSVLIVGTLAAIGSVISALFLANNISKPIVKLSQITGRIATGRLDTAVDIQRRDEIGEMATAFRQMIAYQQQMAQAANRLAQGDVNTDVTPQSEKDELGNAFTQMIAYQQQMARAAKSLARGELTANVTPQSGEDALGNAFSQMITNLRDLIRQVQQGADQVADASRQLNAAAEQTGQASQQVTTTIQQVAQGTAQQTQAVTEVTGNAEQMARAAEGIARGAQEQAQGVQNTSNLIGEMDNIVDQVGQVTGSMTGANAKVTEAARLGVAAVEQTGQGMATIRTRAATTAAKVKEMGARSKEIGHIVETIDDIADKTDMLALNAAVEAARAGEHGRGFAVVADQVRKLSEDSKGATRDITELIERVQETVNEAITAMEGTLTEVDNGTRLAGDTTQSLQDILEAAEEAADLAKQIGQAVAQLKQKSEGVVVAVETVSTVVEENTAVAEEMAANSQEVTDAMEGVASIAEENSASAEQVSASAEEMSAQVEEVVASAEELSALAEELRTATVQFRLEETGRVEQGLQQTQYSGNGPRQPEPISVHHQADGHQLGT